MKKLPQFALGLILTVIISSSVAQAEPIIVVIGLSQHVAVLTVNGK